MSHTSLGSVVLGYGGDRPEQTLLAGRYLLRYALHNGGNMSKIRADNGRKGKRKSSWNKYPMCQTKNAWDKFNLKGKTNGPKRS